MLARPVFSCSCTDDVGMILKQKARLPQDGLCITISIYRLLQHHKHKILLNIVLDHQLRTVCVQRITTEDLQVVRTEIIVIILTEAQTELRHTT
jgi:hypothetical protein